MNRFLLLAAILAALSACKDEQAPAAPPPPEVGVVTATATDLPLQRELSGRLSPYRSADVRARVPGVLQKRVYSEGSEVREGDVLFVIDPAQLQAALGTAQASLAQAQANYANAKTAADRARQLAPTQFISQSDIDNALAARRSAARRCRPGAPRPMPRASTSATPRCARRSPGSPASNRSPKARWSDKGRRRC